MSRRNADLGETHDELPRVNSVHLRSTYSKLIVIRSQMNFNSPIFADMAKRNHSLGSAQAFIVEQALSNRRFVELYLKPFMIYKGENLILGIDHRDQTHFERNVYMERLKMYGTPK